MKSNHTPRTSLLFLGATMAAALALGACSGGDDVTVGSGVGGTGGSGAEGGAGASGGGEAGCPAGLAECAGICVAIDSDEANCGACDNTCDPGEICASGACALVCPAGQTDCDGACIDTDVDATNCGGCGTACAPGELCNGAGQCELTCQAGLVGCEGECIDPNTDSDFCGAGADCVVDPGSACTANQVCTSGSCVDIVRLVFVSSALHDGNFGGLAGADAYCQGLAQAAGLPGSYMAWLSDPTGSPSTRFTPSAYPYMLVDGTKIADDFADLLDGTLDNPINKTELNTAPPAGFIGVCGNQTHAWSNTNADGTMSSANHHCGQWTGVTGNYGSQWGRWTQTDGDWSLWCGGGNCVLDSSIYCFQQ
jgi:Stigma-specific protein, Stig1